MKIKLLSIVLLFSSKFCLSQTIKGKIVSNNYAVPNVEIINANTKTLTVSDTKGNFSIAAKINDTLVFITKEYNQRKLIINPIIIDDKELIIELELKAEELSEVKIPKIETRTSWLTKEEIEQIKLNSSRPKQGLNKDTPQLVGVDFIRIGRQIIKLFKKKDTEKEKITSVNFKDFIKTNCDQSYFLTTLKLKPEETELFLEYCEADPKSKIVAESNNILSTMDFLFQKNIEFKKTSASD